MEELKTAIEGLKGPAIETTTIGAGVIITVGLIRFIARRLFG